jgi:hypothetical protein
LSQIGNVPIAAGPNGRARIEAMRGSPGSVAAVAVAVLALLAVAGCGGSSAYSLARSRSCLQKSGVDIAGVPRANFVASSAEGGSYTARFSDNQVTVSFAIDRTRAEALVRGYQRFRGKNIGLEDVLKVKGNAVMLWTLHPADAHLETIEGCLK